MTVENDRRQHERVGVNDEFATIDGYMAEFVEDVSRGGVFLRCDDPLPVGTKVELRFSILSDDVNCIEGVGQVVNNRSGDKKGMGIQFLTLSKKSRELLDKLCPIDDAKPENPDQPDPTADPG
jgi:uncharacterized protein (TIGR02266 family)